MAMFLLRNDRGTLIIVNTSEASCARFEFGIILLLENCCGLFLLMVQPQICEFLKFQYLELRGRMIDPVKISHELVIICKSLCKFQYRQYQSASLSVFIIHTFHYLTIIG